MSKYDPLLLALYFANLALMVVMWVYGEAPIGAAFGWLAAVCLMLERRGA